MRKCPLFHLKYGWFTVVSIYFPPPFLSYPLLASCAWIHPRGSSLYSLHSFCIRAMAPRSSNRFCTYSSSRSKLFKSSCGTFPFLHRWYIFRMAIFASPSRRFLSLYALSRYCNSCSTFEFSFFMKSERFCCPAMSLVAIRISSCLSLWNWDNFPRNSSISWLPCSTTWRKSLFVCVSVECRLRTSSISWNSFWEGSNTDSTYDSNTESFSSNRRYFSLVLASSWCSCFRIPISCSFCNREVDSSRSFFTALARFASFSLTNFSNLTTASRIRACFSASSCSFSLHFFIRCLYSNFLRSNSDCTSCIRFFFWSSTVDCDVLLTVYFSSPS
mmetsp:Transcript_8955/g.15346  ORF Transcript_8955/g.15346 Transcript_8955/m.15346 type:complete len:330 (-) Transcript_8955:406-1395(-)